MFNIKVVNKTAKQASVNKVKILLKSKEKIPKKPGSIRKEKNPLLYCSLCSLHMDHSDLIDGKKCYSCNNPLFVILWSEYKNRVKKHGKKTNMHCKGYLN